MGTRGYIKRLRALACKMTFCDKCGKPHDKNDQCPTETVKAKTEAKKHFFSKLFKH